MTLRKTVFRQQQQFLEAFEEFVAALWVLPHAQRIRSDRIGPRCAAKAEVDGSGKQGLQDFEAFGDHQRRVVRQHHAARPDTNARRRGRDFARS
jgi:hypothetical protein